MIKYNMVPVITLTDLCQELLIQFDVDVNENQLRHLLWYEAPANDSFMMYYYGDGPATNSDSIEKCVVALLKDYFPDWDEILIDVSW